MNWTFFFYCLLLIRSSRICKGNRDDGYGANVAEKPLMLNGHYVRWPSRNTSENFVSKRRFTPKNIIYTRFQLCADTVFLAAPRYKHGVPFTLGKTSLKNNDDGEQLQPSYDTYVSPFPCADEPDRAGKGPRYRFGTSLVNVVDLVMATDGILWVLDIGVSDTLGDCPSREAAPKIVGFDVTTGKIKHRVSLRSSNKKVQSHYQYLAVEQLKGGNTVLYVGDGGTRSIIVWDVRKNVGNRVKLPHSIVESCTVDWHEDVFHVSLVEHDVGNYVYFTYLSGQAVFRIRTKNLRNRKFISTKCIVNIGNKPGKMVFVGVGYGSILYFNLRGHRNLYSWDTKSNLLEENIKMVRESRDCRTITHVDVDNEGTLWILESNIQDFINDRTGCYGPSILLTSVREAPAVPITDEFNT